jgi:hypothetical protein
MFPCLPLFLCMSQVLPDQRQAGQLWLVSPARQFSVCGMIPQVYGHDGVQVLPFTVPKLATTVPRPAPSADVWKVSTRRSSGLRASFFRGTRSVSMHSRTNGKTSARRG